MDKLIHILQRQVTIGSKITFTLKTGAEISGLLIELGRDHITLECDGGFSTIKIEMIGAWRVHDKIPALSEETAKVSEKKEISVSPPAVSQSPAPSALSSSPYSKSSDPEVIKKLCEIEAYFQAQLQVARIEAKAPDFTFPADEIKGKQGADVLTIWNRMKDKYVYALKINELGAKFGRIQPILNELRNLADRFPNSTAVKRHLAYFYFLSGNQQEALNLYRETALASKDARDWYNVAALALASGQEELSCYGLERFFYNVSLTEALQAWYLYIRLLKKYSNYPALNALAQIKGRDPSGEDNRVLLETGIYLLKVTDKEDLAKELVQKWLEGQPQAPLAVEALGRLDGQPGEDYLKTASELSEKEKEKHPRRIIENQPQGYIHTYRSDRNFGFLWGVDGKNYFFHRSAISDDELFDKIQNLSPGEEIPIIFKTGEGPKGPLAIEITLYRPIEEMFDRATDFANDGEFPKAIAQVKKVLDLDPDYPFAQESYEKWREYARIIGVPKGSNPYARAKRVQLIEKDLDKAAQLLRIAIKQGDNLESAVKDLASLLVQQGKPEDAIDILRKNRGIIQDQHSVDNLLISFCQNAGQYMQAIELLQKRLEQVSSEGKKAQILLQIANSYLRQEDYTQAERHFRTVLKLQPDNRAAQRNSAICLFKQERYDEAERILDQILNRFPDAQAANLLAAVKQARTGQFSQIDEIIIETTRSDFSAGISGFTQFFLDRCDFQGVPPDRVQRQSLNHSDIRKLEDLATQLGTKRPRDRAGYYLSAARIASLLEDEDPNQFYKYLCRSFASRGDATVIEDRPLDAAREFYGESLAVYDGDRSRSKDEQDAMNALVRFMFSTLGQAQIPLKPDIPSIDETLETVLSLHPDRNIVFDAIAYLVFRSMYAAKRILNRLYDKSSLQAMALEYLKSRGVSVARSIKRLSDFVCLWNELQRWSFDDALFVSNELRLIAKIELTTASLESNIERMKRLVKRLFFDLDQHRVTQLQKILETALELCKQVTFEEQERLCIQIDNRCQDLLKEIEVGPTKLSVEEIYPVIETIRKKINIRLEEIYESSAPQVILRLPLESCTPDNNRQIEAQIVVSNRIGCSPAEALELVVQEYEDVFALDVPEIKLGSSLRGGDQRVLKVPIRIGKQALDSQTFSLPVYAQYRTRSGEITSTSVQNFSIRLYSEAEFKEIENPYAAYAEGGVVGDPEMFYGREEVIANISKAIQESRTQSKCVIIYGQKRAGKSSVLHHLKMNLQSIKEIFVLDLGSIGSILDENSSSPFLYQILWSILKKLEYAIEDRVSERESRLDLSFPSDKEFYGHPSPLVSFKDVFERFRRATSKSKGWQGVRPVLLVDEFSYIYGYILAGLISGSFMKNWKALLQENYFSAVLVGQDVMPKFKQRFPNEFGTTQDERVSYLKREDAIKLIEDPIRIGGRQGESRYRERALDRIIELTAGSPFYIQILCNRLVEYMNRKRAWLVTEADVDQVKEEMIRGSNALGLDKFDNLLNSGDTSEDAIRDEDALKLMTAIAVNCKTGPCSRHSIVCETHTPLDEILDDLVKRDVIERERGHYFSIRVGLFKEWLIANQ